MHNGNMKYAWGIEFVYVCMCDFLSQYASRLLSFLNFLFVFTSSVDDIVLGYIVNVLEQLGEDDEFDVDDFSEIMTAYIPEFDEVNRCLVVILTHKY